MAKIQYGPDIRFGKGTLQMIEEANIIISEYACQGFDLTLRQLYYQFVARDYIPNKQSEYKRLGSILNDARLAGLVDWNAIVDRTRFLRDYSFWENPASVIDSAAYSFRVDKWKNQPKRIEAWIEKDALVGVIEKACKGLEVPYFSCRGYVSQSEMWAAAQRIERAFEVYGQPTILIHLGDHDPSGIDMTRDIQDRLRMFLSNENEYPEDIIAVERVALNMEQVRKYNPPPNPAKLTDSRYESYRIKHGDNSWELDALDPVKLSELITDVVDQHLDSNLWNNDRRYEQEVKSTIKMIAANYDKAKELFCD